MNNKKGFTVLNKVMLVEAVVPHAAAAERKLTGYDTPGNLTCDRCRRKGARKNRQRTSYVDEKSNWQVLCPDCQEEADEYWKDMWEEYYRSRL